MRRQKPLELERNMTEMRMPLPYTDCVGRTDKKREMR